MKLTQKLLGFLNRAFSRDPVQFLAMRLRYDGVMAWAVEDAVLTTNVVGGSGAPLVVDLTLYTLAELANHLSAQPGYTVVYQASGEASLVGARTLIGGSGDQDASNGDHLYAFTSLTWAYLDANAVELKTAREQIYQMLRQMAVPTAENEWLDELGGYYNVPRNNGETDALYGPRIVYEVIRPRNNNKAIEIAISVATGGLPSKVTDVTENGSMAPLYSGAINFNGAYLYNASGTRRRNLFDVEYAFDLEGGEDVAPFRARVLELIDKFRSAGTHLRQILLTSSLLSDTVTNSPTDSGAYSSAYTATDTAALPTDAALSSAAAVTIADSATGGSDDDLSLGEISKHLYDGAHVFGGSGRLLRYNSGIAELEIQPSLDLNFVDQVFSHAITFARSSIGTYFDSAGVMQVSSANVPRYDHDPVTLQPLGLLVEEERTNLIFPSDGTGSFGNSNWLTFSPIVVPSGATVSCLWDWTSDAANRYQHVISAGAYSTGQLLTVSWYQKRVNGLGTGRCLDLNSLINASITVQHAKIGETAGGWERWSATVSITDGSVATTIRLYSMLADRAYNGFAAWGLQIEVGPSASSYIPTTTAAASRSADLCSLPVSAWHNPVECTVVAKGEGRVGITNTSSFVSVGTSSNYQALLRQNVSIVQGDSRDASTGQASFSAAGNQGVTVTAGMAVQLNSFAFSVNGSSPATDSAGTAFSGSTALHVGSFAGASSFLNGHIRSIKYWNTRLANELLQLISM